MVEWLRKKSICNNIRNYKIKVLLPKIAERESYAKNSCPTKEVKGFLFYKKGVGRGRKRALFLDYER